MTTASPTEKKKAVVSAYEALNQGVSGGLTNDDDFKASMELICNTDNISIFVMDNSGEPKLATNRDYQILQKKLYSYIFEADTQNSMVLDKTDSYTIRESREPFSQADYLEIVGTLDSGDPFIMQTAIESIRDSAAISNQFFLYVALTAMAFGSLLIWWLSRRISEPLLELTDISRRMAELDFNAKFTSGIDNEIGVLGEYMNEMSENLEKTISELKTANNELQRDIEQKTQIDEMRKEFLSNVSHELKTPIALIQGYAEGLKECINDDAESRDFYCEVIMDEARKMNTMVKNLLSLNQLEFGNDVVTMERFDIVSLIRNVLIVDHPLEKDALGREQRESLLQIEAHLVAEDPLGPGAGAVAPHHAFAPDAAQQIEVLFHRRWFVVRPLRPAGAGTPLTAPPRGGSARPRRRARRRRRSGPTRPGGSYGAPPRGSRGRSACVRRRSGRRGLPRRHTRGRSR